MKVSHQILSVITIALLVNAPGESASAFGAKATYQQYLSSLKNCSPEAIQPQVFDQCKNTVIQAVNWANSVGNEYINSCNNKRTKFIYFVQRANSGIASLNR